MNGILIINKPQGWTSFDVVAKIRNKLGVKKVGHTGTLDPMATGVLVLCLGKATKLAQKMTGFDKEYIGEITLGATSNTDDGEGIIVPNPKLKTRKNFVTLAEPAPMKIGDPESAISKIFDSKSKISVQKKPYKMQIPDQVRNDKAFSDFDVPTKGQVEEVLKEFKGEIKQIPPQFSAKKIKGRRAYAMARKGQIVKLEPVTVTIHELELLEYKWPIVKIRLLSGKGFYVRALARDLGEKLGVGGYLSALRRTKVGDYELEQAVSIEEAELNSVIPI